MSRHRKIPFIKMFILGVLVLGFLTSQNFHLHFQWPTPANHTVEDTVSNLSILLGIQSTDILEALKTNFVNQLPKLIKLPHKIEKRTLDSRLITAIPPELWITHEAKWREMSLPIIVIEPLGRLGNIMGAYATGYALQRIYNASILITSSVRYALQDFQKITLPVLPDRVSTSNWSYLYHERTTDEYNYIPMELAASGLLGPGFFVQTDYPFEIQLFHRYRAELRKEFTFSDDLVSQIQIFLNEVKTRRKSQGNPDPVFVGIHIRRTDYIAHMRQFGGSTPGKFYLEGAMEYYRKKHPKWGVVFIAASDDLRYLLGVIGIHKDVVVSSGVSAIFDLALLSSCNHSIITQGSFGFWSGILAGGEVVYPGTSYRNQYRFSKHMYERVGLKDFTPLPVD